MSKKQKLESLQALGLLKANEVKKVQAALGKPQQVVHKASLAWAGLAAVVGLAYASIVMVIGVAWRLSH